MAGSPLSGLRAAVRNQCRFSSLAMLQYRMQSNFLFKCLPPQTLKSHSRGLTSGIFRRQSDGVNARILSVQFRSRNICSASSLVNASSCQKDAEAVGGINNAAQAVLYNSQEKEKILPHSSGSFSEAGLEGSLQCSKISACPNDNEKQLDPLYPPLARSVVIVESIAKAKVIQRHLGDMFDVLPSYGHVRDIAGRPGSIRPEEDFCIIWEVPSAAWTHLKSIRMALRGAKYLILACNPDREGEAIGWHIIEMLRQQNALRDDVVVARIVFHEITETAIKNALMSPRNVDMDLVNSYLARRAIDYFVGFNMSPLLWRSLPGCRSAGWVHSAALSLICERESEIEQFKPQDYWTVSVDLEKSSGLSKKRQFTAELTDLNSRMLDQLSVCSNMQEKSITELFSREHEVIDVKINRVIESPPVPYVTSSLQQDAADMFHFTAAYTMQIAQKLYEGIQLSDDEATGLITYTRTSGMHISEEAAEDINSFIIERYGKEYAPKHISYCKEATDTQEKQEAIRPTSIRRLPSSLVGILDDDSLKLYALIWTRTLVSQMEASRTNMIQAEIRSAEGNMNFRSMGSRVDFPGYKAIYKDIEVMPYCTSTDDRHISDGNYEQLCELRVKDSLSLVKVHADVHHSDPPPRYSEGALVRRLEELGIGRPPSYASVVKELQDRNYITTKDHLLRPEFHGRMFSAFLSHNFSEMADFSFSADMETQLDNVSVGATEWTALVKDYLAKLRTCCDLARGFNATQLEKMLDQGLREKLFSGLPSDNNVCLRCLEGTLRFQANLSVNGYFIGCDRHPKCKYVALTFFSDEDEAGSTEKMEESHPPKFLGVHPGTDEKVFLKKGPFAHYVQLGEDRKGFSPKRVSVSQSVKDVDAISLDDALDLLQYPKTLGKHPKDNYPVFLWHSNKGFSFRHRHLRADVPKKIDPKAATLEDALKFLEKKKKKKSCQTEKEPPPKSKKKSKKDLKAAG